MNSLALLLAGILVGLSGFGVAHGQDLDPADWAPDVGVLLQDMEALHPDLFHHTTRAEWRAAADDLKHRLPGLEPHLAILEFRRLVALSGDGHTYFRTPEAGWGERLYLPLFLRRFADGWYVRTGHTDYKELFGKRIVAIGDLPMPELLSRLEPYAGSRNRMRILDVAPQLMRLPQMLHAIGVTDTLTPTVRVTTEDEKGARGSIDVTAIPDWINEEFRDADADVPSPKPMYRDFDDNFAMVHFPEHDAMYFYFGEVRDGDNETIAAFTERMFDAIDTGNIGKLIIDLRENNGGNLYLVQPLMHAVIRRGYPPGHLFVLIGRDTWSAAMAFAAQLERETSAIFVGEPTPSPPNFWGDTEPITLPASGIVVEVSSLWWQFSDPRDARPWIAPDVAVTETHAQFMTHRDMLLEAVWNYTPHEETLGEGSIEWYEIETHRLPAIRWQRASQSSYDDSWMH